MKSLYASLIRVIVALLLAFVIWVFVSFTENPQQTISLTNVPVIVEGLPDSMTLVDGEGRPIPVPDDVINLAVSGPQDTLTRINKANIQPYINVAGLEAGIHEVDIQVRAVPRRDGLDFRGLQPASITVTIEDLISTTVPLTLTTTGQPPTSYEAGTPVASINDQPLTQVTISGPRSLVDKAVGGRIELDLSSQTSSLQTRRKISAVDANGRELEGLTVTPELADVQVAIVSSSGLKRVPILYVAKNSPPAGVRPVVTLNPAFVTIVGSSQRLDQVAYIETEPIELPAQAEPFATSVKLRFPLGVTPIDAQAGATTEIQIDWQPLSLEVGIQLPIVTRNLGENLVVQFNPTSLAVQLAGNDADLQQATKLSLIVDLAGKTAGTYQLQPTLQLPNGVTLVEPLPVITVTLSDVVTPPTAVPPTIQPTDQAAPTATTPISPTATP